MFANTFAIVPLRKNPFSSGH